MTVRKIITPAVPEPPGGIFTNCFVLGDQIFISGQTSPGETMEAQTRGVLTKIKHLLEAAGGGLSDIVKMNVYTTDIAKRAEIGKVRAEFFPGDKPCSTMVEVKGLVTPELMVEIDVTAIKGANRR